MTVRSGVNKPQASAVLDTNVALDWLVFRNPGVADLAAAIEANELRWLISPPMRTELGHMLTHASLARWSPDADAALATFDRLTIVCQPAATSRLRCTDRDDQIFIDLALAQGAEWLVTHDRALLKLARRARPLGLNVLTPVSWGQQLRVP
jgi:uncharacterized protein